MVSFGPNVVVTDWTVLSGWIPLPSWTVVTRNGTRGGGGGGWATGGGGGGGGGSSFLQPERTNSDRPTRAAFRSIGVPRLWRETWLALRPWGSSGPGPGGCGPG